MDKDIRCCSLLPLIEDINCLLGYGEDAHPSPLTSGARDEARSSFPPGAKIQFAEEEHNFSDYLFLLTKMVVTISVRLASESVILVDLSFALSVILRPMFEFQTPICNVEITR